QPPLACFSPHPIRAKSVPENLEIKLKNIALHRKNSIAERLTAIVIAMQFAAKRAGHRERRPAFLKGQSAIAAGCRTSGWSAPRGYWWTHCHWRQKRR